MLPKLLTLSLFFAESANVTPCGRIYPRLRAAEKEDVRVPGTEALEQDELLDTEETAEKDRSRDVREDAGVGRSVGEGEPERGGDVLTCLAFVLMFGQVPV